MAVSFNNNNNSELQMLFGKINNGSPFGVIRGFYDYFPNNPNNSPQLRDNTFHFIFDVSNKFLSGKSRLTIEVPRVKLENIKLPDMKEIYVNQWYINIFINTLIFSINEGFYILTGV
ncbi:hypothetical protein HpHNI66_06480 [Helicobacter pylori]